MGLETGSTISSLVKTNPLATDNVSQGDNHIRLIKAILKEQFPVGTENVGPSQVVQVLIANTSAPTVDTSSSGHAARAQGLLWLDTANNLLYIRNTLNTAWVKLAVSPLTDNSVDVNAGTIDGAIIGGSSAVAGTFTTLTTNTSLVLAEDVTIIFEGATDDAYETTLTVVDPTADRTISLPNVTDTLVGKATTDTLTNKTLTSPTINAGALTGAFTGTADLTGLVLQGASPIVLEGATSDAYETTIAVTDPTADRTWTIPNSTDTFVGKATTDTLTNKSIDLGTNTLTGSLAEFNTALQSESFASLTGSETLTNKTLTSPVLNGTLSGTAFLDEDDMSSDSAIAAASQQSIKAYVTAQITAEDLDITTDSGTIDIDLNSETLTIAGGEGIDTSASGTTVTIAGEEASTSNKGVASFSSDNFSVSSGAVTIKDAGVANAELANMAANTIKVRDANSSGVPSDVALTTTQILIGDGTGFTAAALSSDVTMTNAGVVTIANNAVSLAKMAGLARGKIIYGDSSGDPAALTVGSSTQVLTSDGTDISWATPTVGDITSVVAGTGMTGGATSGAATLNVIGGTGITANADDITIDSTVTTLTGSQTLTNKTLTTPAINTGTLTTPVFSGAMTGTIDAFRSTGIDDNADALAMTITSAENVGIGTAAPSGRLDIFSAGASSTPLRVSNSGGSNIDFQVAMQGDNRPWMQIYQGGTEKIRFDPGSPSFIADKLQIGGTGAAAETLEVAGTVKITGGTPGVGKVLASDADGVGSWSGVSQNNLLINGGFDIWQRGVSFASVSYYQWYADRWNGDAFNSANFTVTKQTATTAEPFLSYLRFLRNASSTDTSKGRIGQVYESESSQGLAGQTVTLSFYARVGANWSPATNVLISGIFIGTGTNETTSSGLGSAWTGFVIQNQNNTMTTSWVRFTHTVTLSSVTNQFGIQFTAPASVGTAGAADDWDISGVKLEVGSVATPYVATPYEETIAKCQRYYQKSYNINVNPATSGAVGACSSLAIYSTGSQSLGARWTTSMRAAPAVVIYPTGSTNTGYVTQTSNNAEVATTAGDIGMNGFQYLSGSLPNTAANGVRFHWSAVSEL